MCRWLAPALCIVMFFIISGAAGEELCPFSDEQGIGYISPFDDSGDASNPSPFPDDDPAAANPSPFPDDDPASQSTPCPFPADDPAAANPSPFTDEPVSSMQICPFPMEFIPYSGDSAVLMASSPDMPADPNGDGLYEDLNGNGRADFNDVILYFNAMEWIAQNQPVEAFDYNGNGRIDFGDLILLTGSL